MRSNDFPRWPMATLLGVILFGGLFIMSMADQPTYKDLQSQLTQRTAELEAANEKVQFLEKKNSNLLDSSNTVLKVKADQDVRLADLQAELERVRGELVETSLYLQQERANRDSLAACVDRDVKTIKELRTLIAALPKVEVITSDTVVNIVQQYNFHRWMLRALQHRQGMEG